MPSHSSNSPSLLGFKYLNQREYLNTQTGEIVTRRQARNAVAQAKGFRTESQYQKQRKEERRRTDEIQQQREQAMLQSAAHARVTREEREQKQEIVQLRFLLANEMYGNESPLDQEEKQFMLGMGDRIRSPTLKKDITAEEWQRWNEMMKRVYGEHRKDWGDY